MKLLPWNANDKQEEQNDNIIKLLKKTVDIGYSNSKNIDCLGENTETLKTGIQADIKYTRDTIEAVQSEILSHIESHTEDIKKQSDLFKNSLLNETTNIKNDVACLKESIIQIQNTVNDFVNEIIDMQQKQNASSSIGCQII